MNESTVSERSLPLATRIRRTALTAACTLAVLLQLQPTAWADTWSSVHAPDTRFSISMPGTPHLEDGTQSTVVGDVRVTNLVAKDGDSIYSVSVSFLPAFVTNFVGEQKVYENTQGEILKRFYAKRTGWARKTRAGHTGRVLTFEVPGEDGKVSMGGTAEMYYQDGKLVVIAAVTPQGETGDADRKRFMTSAKLDHAPSADVPAE